MAMVASEFAGVGLNIIFKAASSKGISNYVFILYTYAFAALSFLPFASAAVFLRRSLHLPSDKLSFFFRLLLLAAIGIGSQLCEYRGLEISSPALSSVISNLTPAFTFIFAVLFSVIGAIVISIGVYALLWGKAKEVEIKEQSCSNSYNEEISPLLLDNYS